MEQVPFSTQIIDFFQNVVLVYLSDLNWQFIINTLILSYFVIKDSMLDWWQPGTSKLLNKGRLFLLWVPKTLRVLVIGLFVGSLTIYFSDILSDPNRKAIIGLMLQSLLFVLVFYRIILVFVINYFEKRFGSVADRFGKFVSKQINPKKEQ